jgi:glucose-fructose oxidoreductase
MLIDTVTMKIRCAVAGMGHIAQVAVLPAFAHARRNSQLAAIVSGDRTKRRELANRCRAQVEIERR